MGELIPRLFKLFSNSFVQPVPGEVESERGVATFGRRDAGMPVSDDSWNIAWLEAEARVRSQTT